MYKTNVYTPDGKGSKWRTIRDNNISRFYNWAFSEAARTYAEPGCYIEIADPYDQHIATITYRGSDSPLITFYE